MKTSQLRLIHEEGKSYIPLPSGDVIELSLSCEGDELYIDHRRSLNEDSYGALSVVLERESK